MTIDQLLAAGRNVVSAAAGALVAFGLLKGADAETIKNSLNVIGDATAKIATAVGVLIPIVTSTYAAISASRSSQLAKVAANPEVSKIVVTPALKAAVPTNSTIVTK